MYRDLLSAGLREMNIELSEAALAKLCAYIELLCKWSKAYNLTTVRDPQQIVSQHILDSLTLIPYLSTEQKILDVGTGAGLPGIPIAIVRPDISVTLLDSQQKKINFVQHVITSLQLTNVSAVWARVETLPAHAIVDMVVSRAFASLEDFVTLIANSCDVNTKIVAMKGRKEQVLAELSTLPPQFKAESIQEVQVPGLDAQRCLVFLSKQEG